VLHQSISAQSPTKNGTNLCLIHDSFNSFTVDVDPSITQTITFNDSRGSSLCFEKGFSLIFLHVLFGETTKFNVFPCPIEY